MYRTLPEFMREGENFFAEFICKLIINITMGIHEIKNSGIL